MKYRVTFATILNVTVLIDADGPDQAADLAWEPAEAHTRTASFGRSQLDGAVVLADATFDGIGAVEVEPADDRRHTLDLSALADAPQVTTDDEGRHWRQGREYVAVYVDGELDYQPKEEA